MSIKGKLCAVDYGGRWRVARSVPAKDYGGAMKSLGLAEDSPVWSEDHTTAFICPVGDEEHYVVLGEATPVPDPAQAVVER